MSPDTSQLRVQRAHPRWAGRGAVAVIAILAACSGDGPTEPASATLEILILGGDGQTALAGSALPEEFAVRVQEVATGKASAGLVVEWRSVLGEGVVLSPTRDATDENGIATTRATLGPALGEYRIDVVVEGRPEVTTTFEASATLPPEITSLSVTEAVPGSSIVINGSNFSSKVANNVVLFSGIRGAVTSSTSTQLSVTVPACLPPRSVDVVARLGSLASSVHSLTVMDGGEPTDLALGGALSLSDASGLACTRLSGVGGREYLAVVSSSSQVASARWPYVFTGLASTTGQVTTFGASVDALQLSVARSPETERPGRRQTVWDHTLRRLEADLTQSGVRATQGPAHAPARTPQVGESREFDVLNVDGGYSRVTAEVMHVGEQAAIYLDVNAPTGGLTAADFATLALDFDDPIHPTVLSTFGTVSDLDSSGRVAILFTPVVNELTERGADGFVGGFFFGLDLLPGRDNSNGGEVFYALVPDVQGQFSDPRSRDLVMDVIPAILAHEFQHMVHFNERILALGGTTQEAAWLAEALAQSAEEVVGEAFLADGQPTKAEQYMMGNWIRARRYLDAPGDVSLIVTQGVPTLEERGGGWLFLRYVRDQRGSDDILGLLTRSTRTGVANVSAVSGVSWDVQVPNFSAALYLDGAGVPVDRVLEFPDLDLRGVIGTVSETYPLQPAIIGAQGFVHDDTLWSSSSDFFVIRPQLGESLSVALSGADQGPADPSARAHLTLVRIR